MKKWTFLALFAAISFSASAENNDYQHQFGFGTVSTTSEIDDGFFHLGYRYYATPVKQENTPHQLASFLAQSSDVGIAYTANMNTNNDNYRYLINGRYVINDDWFVGAGIDRYESDFLDNNYFTGELGYFYNDTTEFSVDFGYGDNSTGSGSTQTSSIALLAKSFIPLESTTGVYFSVRASHNRIDIENHYYANYSDSKNVYDTTIDWYINNAWSIGTLYTYRSNTDIYGVKTEYTWRLSDSFSIFTSVYKYIEPSEDDLLLNFNFYWRI